MAETQSRFSHRAKGAAFALAAAASLAIAPSAQAAPFSPQQCAAVDAIVVAVALKVGPATLSPDFKRSLRQFLKPDGKNVTCSGPTDIHTPANQDIDAFNTMGTLLLASAQRISLKNAGLRSIDPKVEASSRPALIRRSDLGQSSAVN